jgi:nucleoside diphosphate kinase
MASPKITPLSQGKGTNLEVTLIMIKPEAMIDGRKERILNYLEEFCHDNGLRIVEQKEVTLTRKLLERHYYGRGEEYLFNSGLKMKDSFESAGLSGKDMVDFSDLVAVGKRIMDIHISCYSGKKAHVNAIIGEDAINKLAGIKGRTDFFKSEPSSLRRRFGSPMPLYEVLTKEMPLDNAIHIPDNAKEAEHDMMTFFNVTPERFIETHV